MTEKSKRKFFELRNGLKAVDFRNKDYFDRIDEHEKSLYSPYMLMRYASSVSSKDCFYVEHYVEMVNECVNKHLFTLSSKHKKLCSTICLIGIIESRWRSFNLRVPEVGRSNPANNDKRVDFPLPDCPMMAVVSPSSTLSSRPLSTSTGEVLLTPGKVLVRFSISSSIQNSRNVNFSHNNFMN